ncbi:MAG: hypothetical protein KJ666_05700 [Bacteroidetes bacterium]|nr:hypothetical protein [Bacteroidota bacterium]MBU2585178.1 hypothetical protein [Bacteroidota bacterium]
MKNEKFLIYTLLPKLYTQHSALFTPHTITFPPILLLIAYLPRHSYLVAG